MRFTIHTPDGETYTTPEDAYPILDNEGTGALHVIRSGGDRTIAVFPAGQWTRYVPAEEYTEEHHAEAWDELLSAVRTVIESKSRSTETPYEFTMKDISGYCSQLLKTAREFADVGIR